MTALPSRSEAGTRESRAAAAVDEEAGMSEHCATISWQRGDAEIERLHHLAHEHCFIANSIQTDVRVEAQPRDALDP
jgi:organic hydroperoxide reductase OsmC/OhrA